MIALSIIGYILYSYHIQTALQRRNQLGPDNMFGNS